MAQEESSGRTLRSAKRKLPSPSKVDSLYRGVLEHDQDTDLAASLLSTSLVHNNKGGEDTGRGMVLRSRSREGERKKYNFTQEELENYEGIPSGRVSSSGRSRTKKRKGSPTAADQYGEAELRISEDDEEIVGKIVNKRKVNKKKGGKKTSNGANAGGKVKRRGQQKGKKGPKGKRMRNSASSDDDIDDAVGVEALMGLAESALLLEEDVTSHRSPHAENNPATYLLGTGESAWSKANKSSLPKLVPFTTQDNPPTPMSLGNIPGTRQRTWKRCATHVATAYYIFYQQRHNLLQSLPPASNPGAQKFLLPLSLDPTFEARMLKEQNEAVKRNNQHPHSPPTQNIPSPHTSSQVQQISSPSLSTKPSLPPLMGQLPSSLPQLQSAKPLTNGSPPARLSSIAPSPISPMMLQQLQMQIASQMHPNQMAAAAQHMANSATQRLLPQQFPFLTLQQQSLMLNNPAMLRTSPPLGPLNPFASLNGASLPNLAPMPPNLNLSPTNLPVFAPGAPTSAQRKHVLPTPPGGVRMNTKGEGNDLQKGQRQSDTTKSSASSKGVASPPTAQLSATGGGIMHRVLPKEQTNSGKKTPPTSPSSTGLPVPILPSPPKSESLKIQLPVPSSANNVATAEEAKVILPPIAAANGSSSSSSFLPSLSRELPMDNTFGPTSVPFAPKKVQEE